MLENILTENQLRKELNLSRSTLFRYRTKLGLQFIRVGNKNFYEVEAIRDFFNKHKSNLTLNGRK